MKYLLKAMTVAAALACGAAQANVIIDDFTVGNPDKVAVTGTGTNSKTWQDLSPGCAHIFGCYRTVTVSATAPLGSDGTLETSANINIGAPLTTYVPGPGLGAPVPGVGTAQLSTNTPSTYTSTFTITWDGDNVDAGFGQMAAAQQKDFSGLSGFQFWARSDGTFDENFDFGTVQVNIKDNSGNVVRMEFPAAPTAPLFETDQGFALVFLPLVAFTNVVGVDFNWEAVAGAQAIINVTGNVEELDFSLRTIAGAKVPEPASLALVGLALLGIGAARSRKSI